MRYTSKSVISIILGLWFLNASGQEQGLLYKISGKGVKKASYLYGTIHLICEDQFSVSDATNKALEKAKTLVLEIDLNAPDLQMRMMQNSIDQENANWVNDLTEEQIAAFDAVLIDKVGVSIVDLGSYKPFVILSMLTQAKFECEKIGSYETYFLEEAQKTEKEILGLETVSEQFAIFDSIPRQEQIDELIKMAIEPEESNQEFEALVEKYVAGDLEGLFSIMLDDSQMGDYQDLLLSNRNERWIPILRKQIKKEPSFIAVGAGHLPGEKGVIQLLRDAGYKVEPVLE